MAINKNYTKPNKTALGGVLGAAMLVAVTFIIAKEGERLEAYRDIAGVWTICHGETLGVKPGDKKNES